MDGDHDIARCFAVTEHTLHTVFSALYDQEAVLENILLKPNMVISGKKCARQAGVEEVATETLRCLRRTVPAAVPGIVFLSGGQSNEVATAHLNAMNAQGPLPWLLSFSYRPRAPGAGVAGVARQRPAGRRRAERPRTACASEQRRVFRFLQTGDGKSFLIEAGFRADLKSADGDCRGRAQRALTDAAAGHVFAYENETEDHTIDRTIQDQPFALVQYAVGK